MQPRHLLDLMNHGHPPTLLDVRTGIEFRSGHIPGAIHAPTWKIMLRLAAIPSNKNTELVVTCELGPRARIAKALLEFFGYRRVALLEGHMAAWRKSNRPLEK